MTAGEGGRSTVAVLGAGLIGHSIAQVFAAAGCSVTIYDRDPAALASVHRRIAAGLSLLEQPVTALDRVQTAVMLQAAVEHADFVVEAVREDLETKKGLFAAVEAAAPREAILASSTSAIPITRIMADLKYRERALGTHWWNPPALIPLVEVIETEWTSPSTIEQTMTLLALAQKTPVRVRKDIPGFIGNRLQHAMWREAVALVQNGICDAATIDTVIKASFGRRLGVLGPLENADLVGIDLTLAVHDTLFPDLDRSMAGLPLLHDMIADGHLGMKAGRGFHAWTEDRRRVVVDLLNTTLVKATLSEREAGASNGAASS